MFKTIAVKNLDGIINRKVLFIYNAFGQTVTEDYKGPKVYFYDDGYVEKRYE